ncbi:hypothetical protein XENTR_v10006958 [Xenopus tropicalis]|nr:hypothetical protein XENTR_v10006958 [Xenopus tropicalis]
MAAGKSTDTFEMGLMAIEDFLRCPPPGIQSENLPTRSTVTCLSNSISLMIDDFIAISGRRVMFTNSVGRKVELNSHFDYKDYRESILSKPMLFLINAKKLNDYSATEKTFALIVNTRHPKIKAQFVNGMNNVISSVFGENYRLQFDLRNTVAQYLASQNFVLTEKDGLSFGFTFEVDVFLDIFHLLGLSRKTFQVTGNTISLHCKKPEKQEAVKMFLAKMTSPLIKLGGSADRRPSVYSLNVSDEDPFAVTTDYFHETSSVLPLTS